MPLLPGRGGWGDPLEEGKENLTWIWRELDVISTLPIESAAACCQPPAQSFVFRGRGTRVERQRLTAAARQLRQRETG